MRCDQIRSSEMSVKNAPAIAPGSDSKQDTGGCFSFFCSPKPSLRLLACFFPVFPLFPYYSLKCAGCCCIWSRVVPTCGDRSSSPPNCQNRMHAFAVHNDSDRGNCTSFCLRAPRTTSRGSGRRGPPTPKRLTGGTPSCPKTLSTWRR